MKPLRGITTIALGGSLMAGLSTGAQARPTTTNSLGMELVALEPGTFRMGSGAGDWDEKPVHEATISQPF